MDPSPNREVLRNLDRFRYEVEHHQGRFQPGQPRVYTLLMNVHSGEMQFAKKLSSLDLRQKKQGSLNDWREVQLLVTEGKNHQVTFKVTDPLTQREIEAGEWDTVAWQVSQETLAVLNQRGKDVHPSKGTLPEQALVQTLASPGSQIQQLPGWAGFISREEAEQRLKGKPTGTFLLRAGDEVTYLLAISLGLSNHEKVRPFILTFVSSEEKMSEYLILQTDRGWILYSDDPLFLDYTSFPTPQELLGSIRSLARDPLT